MSDNNSTASNVYGSFASSTEFWLQNILFYSGFSVVGASCNLFLFILLCIDHKELWKYSFYVLITVFSSAKLCVCLATLVFGLYQTVGFNYPILLIVSRISCITVFSPVVTVEFFLVLIMLWVTIDRAMAIIFPMSYHQFASGKKIFFGVVCLFFIIVSVVVLGIFVEKRENNPHLRCVNPLRYSVTTYSSMILVLEMMAGLIGVVSYIAVLVSFKGFSSNFRPIIFLFTRLS